MANDPKEDEEEDYAAGNYKQTERNPVRGIQGWGNDNAPTLAPSTLGIPGGATGRFTTLSVAQARSRASGVYFLSKGPTDPDNPEDSVPTTNGILLVVCKIMLNIMASAAEAKYGNIFVNTQTAVPFRTTHSKMG